MVGDFVCFCNGDSGVICIVCWDLLGMYSGIESIYIDQSLAGNGFAVS